MLDGKRVELETNPLSPLIKSGAIKIPKADEQWTSNWRGYIATFEVRGDAFVLTSITVLRKAKDAGEDDDAVAAEVLPEVFAGQTEVPATWYSGALIIPGGKIVNYVHMGYGSTYERYTVLSVDAGKIVDRKDLDAKEYTALRKAKFAQFKKTPAYAEHIKALSAGKDGGGFSNDEFLYEYATEEYMALR
ncbi:hypothetical protein [Noviluteimonas gilva]|uniref:Uncharacterized protein n=1 Tax=Noviluteimonas gilva TaxID=2682097 RepID=A0A7C9LGP4_9GAMM|nr:hypothetical protein [Lysobacter gilvus]MUV14161.1 hypothetical protein [Lysobacter gilvus]